MKRLFITLFIIIFSGLGFASAGFARQLPSCEDEIVDDFSFDQSFFSYYIWMKHLADENTLASLSIPGTHDSGTFKLEGAVKKVWGQTQYLNFKQQLQSGIRLFDIRGRATSDQQIVLHHGVLYLYTTLAEFLQAATEFLTNNPSETIILSLKEEYPKAWGVTKEFRDIFKKNYFEKNKKFYKGRSKNPTLGETRGKIVLFDRTGGWDLPGYQGISWENNATFSRAINGHMLKMNVQDEYRVSYQRKEQAVKAFFQTTAAHWQTANQLFINYISLSSGGMPWNSPYYYAHYLNTLATEWVGARAGWVFMDYVGENGGPYLIDRVIAANDNLPHK